MKMRDNSGVCAQEQFWVSEIYLNLFHIWREMDCMDEGCYRIVSSKGCSTNVFESLAAGFKDLVN